MKKFLEVPRTRLVVLLSVLSWGALGAQVPALSALSLTLDEALSLARQESYTLRTDRLTVQNAQRKVDEAWNVFIPSVSVQAALARSNQATTVSTLVPTGNPANPVVPFSMDLGHWALSLGVNSQLVLNPALGNGITALDLELRKSVLLSEKNLAALERDVSKSFYRLLVLDQQVAVLRAQLASLEARAQELRQMFRNGLIPELDVLQAELGVERMRPQVDSLVMGVKTAQQSFLFNLGLPIDQELELQGLITVDQVETFLQELETEVEPHYDLRSLHLSQETLANAHTASVRQLYPSLVLGFSWQPGLLDPLGEDRLFDGEKWTDRGSLTFALSMPVDQWLPMSGAGSKRHDLEVQMAQLAVQEAQAREGQRLELANVRRQLEGKLASYRALQRAVELSNRSLAMTDRAYRVGSKSYTEFRTAQTDALAASLDALNGAYEVLALWLDLAYLRGQ